MDENVVAALVGAGSAIIVSIITVIINLFISRKGVKTETITKNRISWIEDVRKLTMEFMEYYANTSSVTRIKDLKRIRNKVCLYTRRGVKSYSAFTTAMDKCISNPDYNEQDLEALIESAQYTFSEVWLRAKREAGISQREDNKFKLECDEEFNKSHHQESSEDNSSDQIAVMS
ncbi:MAG: hypothetical protein K5875_07960 [Saccharofermentans sp.]|nr:hypothetical protein [Saccharofermentans sp.]